MKMTKQAKALEWSDEVHDMVEVPNTDGSNTQGNCDRCGTLILRFRGQGALQCRKCKANYNAFGNRLRDDLHSRINWSDTDYGEENEIGDMEGNEASYHDS